MENPYELYEKEELYETTKCKFGIKRITSCADEYENEEIFTIAAKRYSKDVTNSNHFQFLGNASKLIDNKQSSSSSLACLNGGIVYKDTCLCPPGFKGNKCDYACGPNTFGADCSGMCSMHQTQCQQKKLCTNSFGCTCPAGYTGKYCETKCTKGTYGVDCNQKCPDTYNAGACDIYTDACKPSYISPNCAESKTINIKKTYFYKKNNSCYVRKLLNYFKSLLNTKKQATQKYYIYFIFMEFCIIRVYEYEYCFKIKRFVKIKNSNAQLLINQSSVLITWDVDDDTKYETPYIVKYRFNTEFTSISLTRG
ncbi:EGF-like, conserved site,EGF-like domain [Cinara cedri]|uniref:EGF-like, conserved site,EGF-like domain n=1 Tax=Cinara cedri TaxID=506608 RepID=A0A5E4NFR7_9HEMI|nr:EGF-like, conserved site,EGF-like domain [Cinara cedri]